MRGAIKEKPRGTMERCCRARARGQGPRPAGSSRVRTLTVLLLVLLLLLLLLPRLPAGYLAAGEARGVLSTPEVPGVSCAPRATCPSGRPRLPRQASTSKSTAAQMSTPGTSTKSSKVLSCGFSHESDPTLRDPEAMTRRWPWMVSVQANGTHICAGTLIASQWVLTVAHCLTQQHVNYTVRVGSPWINQTAITSSDMPVLEIIINRKYQPRRYWSWVGRANDICLLKLQQGLKYSKYVWPICLPGLEYVVDDSSLCTVTGWGYPKVNGMWPQFRTLQEKEVTILNSKKCEQFYHRFSKIPSLVRIINSQMICASDGNREQFCYEITGEPLVCSSHGTWYLAGMMSWGAGCKKSEAPLIFLQVSSYQPWIWDQLSGEPLAIPVPSRILLLAFLLPLSLLVAP
ncbi:probable threonine protease PRSS50 [Nannospalax galili]|uniref:probable threonine protease PRSS50 n=1 Tax=Nannospalax galili TaxID=1026970 RepID=UPI0004ED132C|nr:probable threonine protease PRSS50 [Nannospalax galili]